MRGSKHRARVNGTRDERPPESGPPDGEASPPDLATVHQRLRAGTEALAALSDEDVAAAWNDLIGDVLDPASPFWADGFEVEVGAEAGMHPETLHASLGAALGDFRFPRRPPVPRPTRRPMAAVLAGNVPVLAPQILLPSLVRRRGALIKPASEAPRFTERFVEALQTNLQMADPAFVTARWRGGGDTDRELLRRFDRIAVYGGEEATARFAALGPAPGQLALFGPKFSVGIVSDQTPPDLDGLARDVVLFEQRGCLSVKIVYLLTPRASPAEIAEALSRALDRVAASLPPAVDLASSSGARQWLDVARLLGREVYGSPGRSGVALDEVDAALPPGGRSVSVRTLGAEETLDHLAAMSQRVQGISWTGLTELPPGLARVAETAAWRLAPVGHLQETGPDWWNGGIDLFEWLASTDR